MRRLALVLAWPPLLAWAQAFPSKRAKIAVPFSASPVVPSGGLRTNANARVMSVRGAPIAGLYAAGNAAAHLEFGMGYQAGISLMSALTFGYLCVQHINQGKAT